MKWSRTLDLVVVLIAIAIIFHFYRPRDKEQPPHPPPPASPQRAQDPWQAPAFTLQDVDGHPFTYDGRSGPALIHLSAVGCGDCRARVPMDRANVEKAHQHGMAVWNILVFASRDSGRQFMRDTGPVADRFLVDPDGAVSVQKYRGSDASCWIVIDRRGRVAWQGGNDPVGLDKALTHL